MDKMQSVDIDLHNIVFADLIDAMAEAGGFPVVIIPLDADHQPMKSYGMPIEGRAVTTTPSLIAGVNWAIEVSPVKMVRFVPVETQKPSV